MRWIRIALMMVGVAGMLLVHGCSTKPEPLQYGTDACHACKMTLADNRFGAELVTRKGRVYKFDDLNCMLQFYHAGENDPADFAHKLVINYESPGSFLSADEAFYIKSDEIRSPMASKVAAFETYDIATAFKRKHGGIFLAWGEVTTQFK